VASASTSLNRRNPRHGSLSRRITFLLAPSPSPAQIKSVPSFPHADAAPCLSPPPLRTGQPRLCRGASRTAVGAAAASHAAVATAASRVSLADAMYRTPRCRSTAAGVLGLWNESVEARPFSQFAAGSEKTLFSVRGRKRGDTEKFGWVTTPP
jgi:hypothetical protein